jgi:hypothetical protein
LEIPADVVIDLPAGNASHDQRPAGDGGGLQEITAA